MVEWKVNLLDVVQTDDGWSISTGAWAQQVHMLTRETTAHFTTLNAAYHCTHTERQIISK